MCKKKEKEDIPPLRWLRLTELENAIDNLEMIFHFLAHIDEERKWKWVILATHQALYGFLICAADCTLENLVIDEKTGKLITIWTALKIAKKPLPNFAPNNCFKNLSLTTAQEFAINTLIENFRNEFEHFKPKSWSIEVSGFPNLIIEVLKVIRFLSLESNRVITSVSDEKRINSTLTQIEKWLTKQQSLTSQENNNRRKLMNCRDEILNCTNKIIQNKGINEFSLKEIVDCMQSTGTDYKESTIRTHISSRMCANAPKHHATKFDDFERISHGVYKLIGR